jgi:excisionase family DNA binding protein
MKGKFLTHADIPKIIKEYHAELALLLTKPLKKQEAAKFLDISEKTLMQGVRKKSIPAWKPFGKDYYFYEHELNLCIQGKYKNGVWI